MLKLITITSLMLLVCSCSTQEPPIPANEKAKLLAEQIIDNAQCRAYKGKLTAPQLEAGTIDGIYKDAVNAHCVYNDI
ncbi:MAG: hypothetical protein V4445_03120 [Pseudomonadota bacterium]